MILSTVPEGQYAHYPLPAEVIIEVRSRGIVWCPVEEQYAREKTKAVRGEQADGAPVEAVILDYRVYASLVEKAAANGA